MAYSSSFLASFSVFLYFCFITQLPPHTKKMRPYILTLILLLLAATPLQAQMRNYGYSEGLTTGEVTQIVELPNGQILVNTVGGFSLYDGESFVPLRCQTDSLFRLPSFGRYGHLMQGDTLLWLRDFHYLYLFDVRERRFRYDIAQQLSMLPASGRLLREEVGNEPPPAARWRDTLRAHGILADCPINVVCQDRQRGIWIGTQGQNLFYLPPQPPYAHTIPCPGEKAAQVIANAGGETLIVGTEDGLWRLDIATGSFRILKKEKHALYHSASADREGRVWICSQNGIDCYEKGKLLHYDSHNIQGFVHDHVYFVRQLADGRLLINNDHRLLGFLDAGAQRFLPLSRAVPELQSYRVIIDALPLNDGQHILSLTQNGAFTMNLKSQQTRPLRRLPEGLSYKFNCACQDEEGNLWLGTQTGLAVTSSTDTLPRLVMSGCIRGIVSDGEGHLWIRSSDGLTRIAIRQYGSLENAACSPAGFKLSEADGIPIAGLQERSMVMTPKGMLCIANACGVTSVDTKRFVRASASSFPLVLTGGSTSRRVLPLQHKCWYLHSGEKGLEISFSALNYAAPSHTHYRYRLRGESECWTETTRGKALFTALPSGRYRFEAQAAVFDGQWGPLFQQEVVVRPPVWQTWWAIAGYIALFLLAMMGAARWYVRRTRAALEAKNDERVNQLFLLRDEARHRFAQTVKVTAKEIAADSREEEMMEKMMESVGRNLDNCDYTVDMLANDVCMSRASLYRNVKNMLGITPNEFIRNTRLKQAARMLEETNLSINEISMRVGFGSSRYFTMQFKRVFGVLPSEYQSRSNK